MADDDREKKLREYEEKKRQEEETQNEALELMGKASKLSEIKDYDEALKLYNEAVKLLQKINWTNQIVTIQKEITKLEIEKKHSLQSAEKQRIREERQRSLDAEQASKLEEQARSKKEMEKQRVLQYEENKKREEQKSNQAYDLMEKASEFVKASDFDKALGLYDEILGLFEEIKWSHEIQTTQKTIARLNREKAEYLKNLEEKRAREEHERRLKAEHDAKIEEDARKHREKEERERAEKIAAIEGERDFKQRITDMGEEADKMVRDYEIEIKKDNFDAEPPYEKALEIYRNMRQMLQDRGWSDQVRIASNQITHFKQKIEQDIALRGVEQEKIRKHQEYLDSLKFTKKEKDMSEYESKKKEEEDFQNQINDIMNKADRMHRDYEIEFLRDVIKEGGEDLSYAIALKNRGDGVVLLVCESIDCKKTDKELVRNLEEQDAVFLQKKCQEIYDEVKKKSKSK